MCMGVPLGVSLSSTPTEKEVQGAEYAAGMQYFKDHAKKKKLLIPFVDLVIIYLRLNTDAM